MLNQGKKHCLLRRHVGWYWNKEINFGDSVSLVISSALTYCYVCCCSNSVAALEEGGVNGYMEHLSDFLRNATILIQVRSEVRLERKDKLEQYAVSNEYVSLILCLSSPHGRMQVDLTLRQLHRQLHHNMFKAQELCDVHISRKIGSLFRISSSENCNEGDTCLCDLDTSTLSYLQLNVMYPTSTVPVRASLL